MRQFEESTQDYDGCAPRVSVVKKGLSGYAVHPVLQSDYKVYFAHDVWLLEWKSGGSAPAGSVVTLSGGTAALVQEGYFFLPLPVLLVVLAFDLTQRNPTNERGWFWYSQVRQAERMKDIGSFHEPPRTLFLFSTYGSSLAAL